jgi:flagellar capping protein FliD
MGILGGGISINGPSGIDTASLVEQLTALEQERVTVIEKEKTKYQVQIDAYSKLKSTLSTLASKAAALKTAGAFDVFKSVSTNEKIVTLKGDVGATEAMYDIGVHQLARNEKMISKDNQITDQGASLSSQGITVGDISIEGTTITVDANDTIQDLRMKINAATDADGKKLNVSASVLKVSSTDFRLVLTSKNTGSAGIDYQDVSGTTFFDLGIITGNGANNKGNVAQVLESQADIETVFNGLAAGDSLKYSGTDRDGNTVTHTYIKPAANTSIDDFLAQIKKSFHEMADVTLDTGRLVITDKVQGTSQLTMSTLTIAGTDYAVDTTVVGDEGAGVLSIGKDAFFNVDGLSLVSTDNEAEGVIAGVTVQLHKASVDETVQTSLTRDTEAIEKKVKDLLDAYNELAKFVANNTKMADPSVKDSKAGDLAGDMTAKTILDQVRNALKLAMPQFGGSYNSLTMFGVKSDAQSGEMSLDSAQFSKALNGNFDEVVRFFVTTGISDNKNIALGRFTKDTQSGNYSLQEPDASHFQIQFGSDPTWYVSDARSGDIVTFSSGPANGLSITAAAGTIGAGSATFTFAKGLGDRISELIDGLNDPGNGMITQHQSSLQDSIKSTNDRIGVMQKRVNDYHDRLVMQFTAMEQAMQAMRNQQANMLSALGATTASA